MRLSRTIAALFLLLSGLLMQRQTQAQEISIGFPPFPSGNLLFEEKHPVGPFLRAALLNSLTRAVSAADGQTFALDLADNFEVSPDYLLWWVKVRDLTRFSNGQEITAYDARYSLDRCHQAGVLSMVDKTRVVYRGEEPRRAGWVEIKLKPDVVREKVNDLPRLLSDCPIFERKSSMNFGDELGSGTDFVAGGAFVLDEVHLPKSLTLVRSEEFPFTREQSPQQIVLRSFTDDEAALSALRHGTVDAFYASDQGVIARAQNDETLFASECSIYRVVQRKGFRFLCDPQVRVTDLFYER